MDPQPRQGLKTWDSPDGFVLIDAPEVRVSDHPVGEFEGLEVRLTRDWELMPPGPPKTLLGRAYASAEAVVYKGVRRTIQAAEKTKDAAVAVGEKVGEAAEKAKAWSGEKGKQDGMGDPSAGSLTMTEKR
jgi:hypothetical protein